MLLHQVALSLLPLGMLSSSVLVVTAASPVLSVLFVVALFLLSALYMVLAGLPFVGLLYLLVYVGAVAVLFLFVVMMLNVPLSVYGGNEQAVPLQALFVSIFLLVYAFTGSDNLRSLSPLSLSADTATVSLNQAQALASELFTHDALLLVLVGIVLLLSMVGPVSMSVDHDAEGLRQLEATKTSA
jgi:NADH:ubiquinone oxidoreductase subunit 6 (subunit J)